MSRLLLAATLLLVMWGALAFGAVYAWAWRPLVTGAAVVGAAACLITRPQRTRAHDGALLLALAGIGAATAVQLIPLPRETRIAVSPATEAVLMEQDIEYALVTRMSGQSHGGATALVPAAIPARPLSLNPSATARALVLLCGLTALLAGLTRLLSVTGARRLTMGIVLFGAALGVFGIVQKATLGDHAYAGMKIYGFWTPNNLLTTPYGPFVNKNHFAGWMLMALPLGVGLGLGLAERGMRRYGGGWRDALRWISSPDGGRLQLVMLATFVMGVSLALTASRSGAAGFVIAMFIAGVVVTRRFGGRRSRSLAVGALLTMIVLVFVAADVSVAARFGGRHASMELRKRIWHDSLTVVRDFPLVGTGLNTFGTAMLSYQSAPRDLHFREAHNEYLQIAVEGGLLLSLPVAVALVLLVRRIRHRFAVAQDDPMTYWLRAGATAGLVAIGLQSLVEFSLQMPGNAALCVVLMAIALHQPPRRGSRAVPPPAPTMTT